MKGERLEEIYDLVVNRGFYHVGSEPWLNTDISHEEMQELVQMAYQSKKRPALDAGGPSGL